MTRSKNLWLAVLISLLAGCTSPEPRPELNGHSVRNQVETWLAQADQANSPQREQLRLQAAELLLENRELDAASNTLSTLNEASLNVSQRAWWLQLRAALSLAQGQPAMTLTILNDVDLAQTSDQLPLERQLALGQLRARALALTGNHFAAAQERIFLGPLLPPAARTDNREAIWQSLMYLEPDKLQEYRAQALSGDLQGWLELAMVARDTQLGLQSQADALASWMQRWPQHPANDLPDSLRLIRELAARQPRQVALMLPLSGRLLPFGRAVRDGFMAAWYQQPGQRPAIKIYDTAAHDDIVGLYHQAVQEGAELVIGPLDKQRVRDLQLQTELPAPILALNRSELEMPAPDRFYQFGLAPEDEALLLADAAAQQRFQRALILSPSDDSSQRIIDTFGRRWQALGGTVVGRTPLDRPQQYSERVAESLNLNLSRARAIAVERTIGRDVEFTPRRRQDVDFVLLLTRPQSGRSLKPLLAYHYAGGIPVYATSRIYEGYPQPTLDRDLDGIVFSEIPWLLSPDAQLRKTIEQAFPQQRNYLRLYALGIDSFRLYPRLEQLAQLPNSRLPGRTGYLKLNQRGEVERELSLAQFRSGKPQRLPSLDRSMEATVNKDGQSNEEHERR